MKYIRLLSCLLHFTIVKLGLCVKIYLSAFEVSITGVLVACAVCVGVWGTPVVYRGGWPVDCASCLYALEIR